MNGLTDYITQCPWEDIFIVWFVLVDDIYKQLFPHERILRERGPEPRFSDSEVITVAMICDTFFGGNEELGLCFVRQHYLYLFPNLLEYSRFNRRRRSMALVTEEVRRILSGLLISPTDGLRLVDAAPIPVCTYMRSNRCSTFQGAEYCSIIPSKRAKLFGVRIHMTCSWEQVADHWTLAPASFRETRVVESLLAESNGVEVIGDQGYQSAELENWLKQNQGIRLLTAKRRTDKVQWPEHLRSLLNRARRRIETAFSVLATVFHIERSGSRSLSGLVARTASRILAYNISFLTAPILMTQRN